MQVCLLLLIIIFLCVGTLTDNNSYLLYIIFSSLVVNLSQSILKTFIIYLVFSYFSILNFYCHSSFILCFCSFIYECLTYLIFYFV